MITAKELEEMYAPLVDMGEELKALDQFIHANHDDLLTDKSVLYEPIDKRNVQALIGELQVHGYKAGLSISGGIEFWA